jgi:hypothetical protein
VQWLNENGVISKIYKLDSSNKKTSGEGPEGVESIVKVLPMSDDEMLDVSLQFYRHQARADEVISKMM